MLLTDKIVSVTEFRKNPMQGNKQDLLCVLKNSKPEFYCIDPVRLQQLIKAEKMLERIKQDNEILDRSNKSLVELSEMPF